MKASCGWFCLDTTINVQFVIQFLFILIKNHPLDKPIYKMYCVIYLEHLVKARVYLLFLKKIKKGSRLVVVNNGLKHPYAQINYGSGKDVSNETVKNDANEPLIIKWFSDSYIKIPIKR